MHIQWHIAPEDVIRVKDLVQCYSHNALVLDRYRRNLSDGKSEVTKERFWRAMVCTRLTTQQRSGPGSPVSRFQATSPFPLRYALVATAEPQTAVIVRALKEARGIRFSDKIADELGQNLRSLENGGWSPTLIQCNRRPSSRHVKPSFKSPHMFGKALSALVRSSPEICFKLLDLPVTRSRSTVG